MSEEPRDDMILIKERGMRDVVISLWLRLPSDHSGSPLYSVKYRFYKDRDILQYSLPDENFWKVDKQFLDLYRFLKQGELEE